MRLGGKYLYLLSHLASPYFLLYFGLPFSSVRLHGICVWGWVCVFMGGCSICATGHMWRWEPPQFSVLKFCFEPGSFYCFLLHNQTSCLVSFQAFSYFHLSSCCGRDGEINTWLPYLALCELWGSQPRPSHLCRQYFTHWEPTTQPHLFFCFPNTLFPSREKFNSQETGFWAKVMLFLGERGRYYRICAFLLCQSSTAV